MFSSPLLPVRDAVAPKPWRRRITPSSSKNRFLGLRGILAQEALCLVKELDQPYSLPKQPVQIRISSNDNQEASGCSRLALVRKLPTRTTVPLVNVWSFSDCVQPATDLD